MKLVSIEIAKKLKEKNFKELCIACYDGSDMLSTYSSIFTPLNYNTGGATTTSAPLLDEVIDWFEKNHMIKITSEHQSMTGMWFSSIWRFDLPNNIGKWSKINMIQSFQYKNEAIEKSIEEALKLI